MNLHIAPDPTLFLLQVIHFWMAYWILRRWVVGPLCAVIAHQEQQQSLLADQLHAVQQQAFHAQAIRDQSWKKHFDFFKKHIPVAQELSVHHEPLPELHYPHLNPQEIDRMRQDLLLTIRRKLFPKT